MTNDIIKRAAAVALSLSLGFSGAMLNAGAVSAQNKTSSKTIDAEFTEHINLPWNDSDLLKNSLTAGESTNLAVAGLVMSRNSEESASSLDFLLVDLGFGDITNANYKFSTTTNNKVTQPARTFGHKLLTKDGKEYHVICAVFKGTTTKDDARTDALSVVDGFYYAGKHCRDDLAKYIAGFPGATKDNTILFITGHSLGASTANVVGLLSDDLVKDEHKFVYTYASPNYKTDPKGATAKSSYKNIHNFINTEDVVPKVPLTVSATNFSKLGTEHTLSLANMTRVQRAKFDRVYEYFRGRSFVADSVLLKPALSNHLAHTYMAFILSELSPTKIDSYLQNLANSDLKSPSSIKVILGQTVELSATATGFIDCKSSNTKTATVSGKKITGKKVGTTTVKVTSTGTSKIKSGSKTVKVTVLKRNPIKVKGKAVSVKKGKKATIKRSKVLSISNAKGSLSYKKTSGNKKITISSKTGNVTVKKGLKKGKYTVKVKVKAAGNKTWAPKNVSSSFVINVK